VNLNTGDYVVQKKAATPSFHCLSAKSAAAGIALAAASLCAGCALPVVPAPQPPTVIYVLSPYPTKAPPAARPTATVVTPQHDTDRYRRAPIFLKALQKIEELF
jgi:hypothetical protein